MRNSRADIIILANVKQPRCSCRGVGQSRMPVSDELPFAAAAAAAAARNTRIVDSQRLNFSRTHAKITLFHCKSRISFGWCGSWYMWSLLGSLKLTSAVLQFRQSDLHTDARFMKHKASDDGGPRQTGRKRQAQQVSSVQERPRSRQSLETHQIQNCFQLL